METFRRMGLTLVGCVLFQAMWAARILVPMDDSQTNHLKAYGVAFWVLENGVEVEWLLNYRGGSFLLPNIPEIQNECVIRGVSHQVIADVQAGQILQEIADPEVNMERVKLEVTPKIAVYSHWWQTAMGRCCDLGFDLRRNPIRRGLRHRDPDGRIAQIRLAPPSPRRLYGAVRQILPGLSQRFVVPRGGRPTDRDGRDHGVPKGQRDETHGGHQHSRLPVGGRILVHDVFGNRQLRHRPRSSRGGHLRPHV